MLRMGIEVIDASTPLRCAQHDTLKRQTSPVMLSEAKHPIPRSLFITSVSDVMHSSTVRSGRELTTNH